MKVRRARVELDNELTLETATIYFRYAAAIEAIEAHSTNDARLAVQKLVEATEKKRKGTKT